MLSRPDAASSSPGGREDSRAALERRRVRPASTRTASCAAWQKPSPSLSLRPAPPGGLEVGRSLCGEAAARVGRHPEPAFALRPTLRLLELSAGTRRLVVRVALHACVPGHSPLLTARQRHPRVRACRIAVYDVGDTAVRLNDCPASASPSPPPAPGAETARVKRSNARARKSRGTRRRRLLRAARRARCRLCAQPDFVAAVAEGGVDAFAERLLEPESVSLDAGARRGLPPVGCLALSIRGGPAGGLSGRLHA
jgi:hypothetical protein